MERNKQLYSFVLRLADNSMVLAQRLAEWCSRGPILEEDLALTNMSLDLLGQAENFYNYAAQVGGENQSADNLAFLRSEREYFNSLLVEQPNGDFAFTMVKQMLYSSFAKHLFEALTNSTDENLSGLAAKSVKEVRYHFRHSSEWVIRFGNGTEKSKARLNFAINELWRFTDDMFEMSEADELLINKKISINLNNNYPLWKAEVSQILEEANIEIPEDTENIKGGIKGIHTEHLGHLLCEMQYLQRAHPEATW